MNDLFDDHQSHKDQSIILGDGAVLLPEWFTDSSSKVLETIAAIVIKAPFRTMITPGGLSMSISMSNCGQVGWVSDRQGYRYCSCDPCTGLPWPAMPDFLRDLATEAARQGGYQDFVPDACLINRYDPGTKLSLHQDRDERDFSAPIVSLSLGLTARFQFGGLTRTAPVKKFSLRHGDCVVWGGAARLAFHGILPLKDDGRSPLGPYRLNLTFRKAL